MSGVFMGYVLCCEVEGQLKVRRCLRDAALGYRQVIAIHLDADELMPELDGGYSGGARSQKRIEYDVGRRGCDAVDELADDPDWLRTRMGVDAMLIRRRDVRTDRVLAPDFQ